jgi:hypothetical protein
MAPAGRVTRRRFLASLGAGAVMGLTAACSGTTETPEPVAPEPETPEDEPADEPAASPVATPIRPTPIGGASRTSITLWGRQQALPEANIWLTESARLAAREGGFDIRVELASADAHDRRERQAMDARQMPDLSMTALGTLWWQNGWSRDVQDVYADVGASGGGWFDAPEAFSKMDGKRIGVPLTV